MISDTFKKYVFTKCKEREDVEWNNPLRPAVECMAFTDGIKAVLDALGPTCFGEYAEFCEKAEAARRG